MDDMSRWGAGRRMSVRRGIPHAGAQLTFTDIDGRRFQTSITDQTDPDIAYLEAVQRGRGRAEKLICNLKDTGCTNLPSADFQINQAWLTTCLIAHDLLIWCQRLCLTGDLARAEPKRLRYTLLHTAGVIVRSGRQTGSASPPAGPGPNNSSTRSPASAPSQPRPELASTSARTRHPTMNHPRTPLPHPQPRRRRPRK